MFKCSLFLSRCSLFLFQSSFLCALFIVSPAVAQKASPPKEFWDYLEEYGDDSGNVLDPLEYDHITHIKNDEKQMRQAAPLTNEQESIDKPMISNTEVKFKQRSSAQTSSSAMKGVKL